MDIFQMLLQILMAFLAALGFGILFALNGKKLFYAGISGALGWLVYLLSLRIRLSESISFVMASLSMTIYSEIAARKLRSPAITFLIGGLIPLVPGSNMYYTMYALIRNNINEAVKKGVQTLMIAGAIAIGILVGSTICKIYYTYIKHNSK